jgi:hypothetical protein
LNIVIDQLITLVQTHAWLMLAIVVLGYINRLIQPESKFPITIPLRLQPVVSLGIGQLYAVLVAHVIQNVAWFAAIEQGLLLSFVTGGFFDHLGNLIFPNGEPGWFKAIMFIVEDVGSTPKDGKGGSGTGGSNAANAGGFGSPPMHSRSFMQRLILPSPLEVFLAAWCVICMVAIIVFAPGCATLKPIGTTPIPADTQAEIDCVASKLIAGETGISSIAQCVGGDITIAADIVEWLLSGAFAKQNKLSSDKIAETRASIASARSAGSVSGSHK